MNAANNKLEKYLVMTSPPALVLPIISPANQTVGNVSDRDKTEGRTGKALPLSMPRLPWPGGASAHSEHKENWTKKWVVIATGCPTLRPARAEAQRPAADCRAVRGPA